VKQEKINVKKRDKLTHSEQTALKHLLYSKQQVVSLLAKP
jgi:hypothetical protein